MDKVTGGGIEELRAKREELYLVAKENDEASRKRAKENYDRSKKSSTISKGDYILLRKENRADSLDPKFDGPFRVLEHRGAI